MPSKNPTQWRPPSGNGYIINDGTNYVVDEDGNFLVDENTNFVVSTETYAVPKYPTAWEEPEAS